MFVCYYSGTVHVGREKNVATERDHITEIDLMDQDHDRFFSRIQWFEERIKKATDCTQADTLKEMFDCIEKHIFVHFTEEEILHQKYQYPHAVLHNNMHSQFKNMFFNLNGRLEREGTSSMFIQYAKDTVTDWMTTHVKELDQSFCEFLRRRNA